MSEASVRYRSCRFIPRGQVARQASSGDHNTMQREQTLDPIDQARPLPGKRRKLTMQLLPIVISDARNMHDAPDASLTGNMAAQFLQQRGRAEAIRLRLATPGRAFNRGRIDHETRQTDARERAMHPGAITSRLIAAHHRGARRQAEAALRPRNLSCQRGEIASRRRPKARRLSRPAHPKPELPCCVAKIEREQ